MPLPQRNGGRRWIGIQVVQDWHTWLHHHQGAAKGPVHNEGVRQKSQSHTQQNEQKRTRTAVLEYTQPARHVTLTLSQYLLACRVKIITGNLGFSCCVLMASLVCSCDILVMFIEQGLNVWPNYKICHEPTFFCSSSVKSKSTWL